ncbi:MAG: cation efflux protein, CzcI family [Burkholderiaceae bacterium]
MRRLLVLVFALLLPLQFAWAGAAAYCQHENTPPQGTAHLGHHEHVHKGEQGKPAGAKPVLDNDCGVCHGAGTAALVGAASAGAAIAAIEWAAGVGVPGHPSAPGGPPERPQWPHLA